MSADDVQTMLQPATVPESLTEKDAAGHACAVQVAANHFASDGSVRTRGALAARELAARLHQSPTYQTDMGLRPLQPGQPCQPPAPAATAKTLSTHSHVTGRPRRLAP